jgi:ABC-type histidine transport system ATPase subunit
MSLLEVSNIHGGYGGADILKGVSMRVVDGGLGLPLTRRLGFGGCS